MGAVVRIWLKSLIDTFKWGRLHSAVSEWVSHGWQGHLLSCLLKKDRTHVPVTILYTCICAALIPTSSASFWFSFSWAKTSQCVLFWKLRGCGFRIWETISKPPLSHCEQEPLLPVDQWHGSASEHSGVQYAKSLSIQYSSNINICQNPLIHINIFLNLIIDSDFFQKSLYRY